MDFSLVVVGRLLTAGASLLADTSSRAGGSGIAAQQGWAQ